MKKNITFAASSLVKSETEKIMEFSDRILIEIQSWPKNTQVGVFPEYCWNTSHIKDIMKFIDKLSSFDHPNLILGSHAFRLENKITNNAIILHQDGEIEYRAKSQPLIEEINNRKVQKGGYNNYIQFSQIKIGVIICADLWNWKLVDNLVEKQQVDALIIPAFTAVPLGFSIYAKYQWFSLGLTRSREFIIPIIIADHLNFGKHYDVGAVTSIIDPSIKHDRIKNIEDFFYLSESKSVVRTLDFDKISNYRTYRKELGIYQS